MFLGKFDQLSLFLGGESGDGGSVFADSFEDEGKKWVPLVIHESLGESLDGGIETLRQDLVLVGSLEGFIQLNECVVDKFLELSLLVGSFEGLGLFKDIERSISEVVLEIKVLVGEEIVDGLSLDFRE